MMCEETCTPRDMYAEPWETCIPTTPGHSNWSIEANQ